MSITKEGASVRKFINIKTDLPGPKSKEWLKRLDNNVAKPLSVYVPAIIDHAKGALITDIDGNTFLDFSGGLGVLNVGHANDKVIEAVKEQVERFTHTDFSVFPYESLIRLAERINKLAPGDDPKKTVFFNAGAEAVENAVKIAKAYTGKKAIIVYEGAFHGRTMLTMTMTSKPEPYKSKFAPFAPDVYRVPYPNCYRCPFYKEPGSCNLECFTALEKAFDYQVSADDVGAIVIEPLQGEGGFNVPRAKYMKKLRELCDEKGILLIDDEIQAGIGRTGKMCAIEHFGIEPDLITFAKSIAGGLPLSGVVGKAEIMDSPDDSSIGGTFIGNPIACAAGNAVLDFIEENNLFEKANHIGEIIMERGKKLQEKYDVIGDVRGLGAMIGYEFVKDRKTKEPNEELVSKILQRAVRKGAIFIRAGVYHNVIRFLNTLVMTDEQLNEGLDVLEEAIQEALND